MIILHPDGTYEVCPIPPLAARWLRALRWRQRAALCAEEPEGAPDVAAGCDEPCREPHGAICRSC